MSILNIIFSLNYLVDYKISFRIIYFGVKIECLEYVGITVRHPVFGYEDR